MNKDIKAKWLNDLRSGDIEQIKSKLGDSDGRCCLGVLCDIAVREGAIPEAYVSALDGTRWYLNDLDELDDNGNWKYEAHGEYGLLPVPVMRWAGLTEVNPHVVVPEDGKPDDSEFTESVGLSDLNDDREWTFGMIADVIDDQF